MGLENLSSRLFDETGQITPEKVTAFYEIKDKIWGTTSIEELGQIANSLGISLDRLHDEFLPPGEELTLMRKGIFKAFLKMRFPCSSIDKHMRRLDEIIVSTRSYFNGINTTMVVGFLDLMLME